MTTTALDSRADARRPSVDPRVASRIVAALSTWLEPTTVAQVHAQTSDWSAAEWAALPRFISIHGLASRLMLSLDPEVVLELPSSLTEWLAQQLHLNSRRIDRMHAELGSILAAASAAGIRVMPLKGALLTTMPGLDPHRRPMGDLDLLVQPEDAEAMGDLMARLGYVYRDEPNPRPLPPRMYVRADNERVVSLDEHPDNPRRVEIHVAVMRHLWVWTDEDDLTSALWRHARDGTVLGQPAVLPSVDDLFAHVAIHASSDLFVNHGRLGQWADIADLMTVLERAPATPHPRLAYISVRLAARSMPQKIRPAATEELESQVPSSLRRWADAVEIPSFSGLMTDRTSRSPWTANERWRRWWPTRWRLAVAYGDTPLPIALTRHARVMGGYWRARYRGPARQPFG